MNLTALLSVLSLPVSLFKTTCPTEIHATIPHQDRVFIERRSKSIHQIHSLLGKCPNITTLDLRFAFIGCIAFPERWSLPIDPAGGTKYRSAIQSLSLDGYNFDSDFKHIRLNRWEDTYDWITSGNAWKSLKWSLIPKEQRSKTNLELWIEAMDFSQLRTLSIRRYSPLYVPGDLLAQVLSPKLQRLRSLKIEGPELRDFLLALPAGSLSSLSWIDSAQPKDQIRSVLEHHGASLTELEWRTSETLSRPLTLLPDSIVEDLKAVTPNLQSLSIDLNRDNDSWPLEKMKTVVNGMPDTLKNLSIYFEMASESRRQKDPFNWDGRYDTIENFALPLLNSTSAREMASFLRNHGAESLEEVNFFAGDWTQDYGEPLQMTDWLHQRRAWMNCKMPTGDGEINCQGRDTWVPVKSMPAAYSLDGSI
ncbi:hypothetical protein CkaCkLH20_10376 [Colletotrichum karsti]|uniref:F-box domain-containing protein n=1 Tax=Colletotrichum karsti TaxID=1095194 RepID=A0A9P6LDN0_9PEZI|nr:uncharacterized protein CkaCkLH20_10376 [Colletotrichum karsti]KAF9872039.1 hypothetical protein CkaCkLH20_10376 [Colletotrichum karsti]